MSTIITPGRATGNTTRQVDQYIQDIFASPNEWVAVPDHWGEGTIQQANRYILDRVQRRMHSEHLRGNQKLEHKWIGNTPYVRLVTPSILKGISGV